MENDDDILARARMEGLDKVVDLFSADVLAAARSAEMFRKGLGNRPAPRSEPWPPMRMKGET